MLAGDRKAQKIGLKESNDAVKNPDRRVRLDYVQNLFFPDWFQ